jgi:hypothetical protein
MRSQFDVVFDEEILARGFGIAAEDARNFMMDGRVASFVIPPRLRRDNPGWSLIKTKGGGWGLRSPSGGLWNVRSVTGRGVLLNPSAQIGSGRQFGERGFLAKLQSIAGFIISGYHVVPEGARSSGSRGRGESLVV